MPDPNATGALTQENLTNSPWAQGKTPPVNAQPSAPATDEGGGGIVHGILRGALAAATAMAGPDANGKPRHGLAPILGGILSGAMTGLAAGADRSHGEAGGGLAAMARGASGVMQQNQSARQQAFENQEATDRMQLEKAANARAQQQLIIQQHEMGRLDQEFQLRRDEFEESKLQRLATLRVENNNIRDRLLKLHAVPVPGAPEAASDEELKQWAMKNMGAALGKFDTLPVQDPESGKWSLYQVPKDQEMTVTYGGKQYTVPVDPAILVKAAQDETRDQTEKVKAEADLLRAKAEAARGTQENSERAEALQERKDELAERKRHNQATEGKTPGGTSQTVKTTEPTIMQGISNVTHGKDFNAPIKTTTQTVRGPAPMVGLPPSGATGTVMGSDGKMHWTDGKNDLGVAQ